MSKPFRYFRVTGGKIAEAILDFKAKRFVATQTRDTILALYGATGTYGMDGYYPEALQFTPPAKPPEGWRPNKRGKDCWIPPKGKAGKEVRENLQGCLVPGASAFAHSIGCGGWMHGDGHGSLIIRYPVYEEIDNTLILLIPAEHGPGPDKWTPPDEGCTPLKASEYWQLKEAAEAVAV